MTTPATRMLMAGGGAAAAYDFSIWSPTLWLDASDAATITESGGAVSQWDDKSSNGFDVTATGTAQPTTGTRTINGLNALDFDGSTDIMATATAKKIVDASGYYTVWAVVECDSVTGDRSIVDQDDETGNRQAQQLRTSGTATQSVRIYGGVVADGAGVTLSTGTPYLMRSQQRLNALETWVNNSSDGSSATTGANTSETAVINIGAHRGLSLAQLFNGKIGFVLVVPSALSSGDMATIETAINNRWACY